MESNLFNYESVYCPEAVASWYLYNPRNKNKLVGTVADLKLNAKKHLSYVGWIFRYVTKSSGSRELRYISPKGKSYFSLKTACKACILEEVNRENCCGNGIVVSNKESSQCTGIGKGLRAKRKRRACIDDNLLGLEMKKKKKRKCRQHHGKSDFVCSVCRCGDNLITCGGCPSAFHSDCLGLNHVPDDSWFCPSCCCKICHKFKIGEAEIVCAQCNFKYHEECLRNKYRVDSVRKSEGNLFCCSSCEGIYATLNSLVGKKIVVGEDGLTWTILKPSINSYHLDKLTEALEVLRTCFDPIIDDYTGTDLIEDTIFNTKCDLQRLNCHGFYTVILERDDDVVSVATLRVFGEKVAELPLVGTRIDYWRRGMCRKLMDELEKQLVKMDVKKLILPACKEAISTWTDGFGFTIVAEREKKLLRDYTFIGFRETVVCQKLLKH